MYEYGDVCLHIMIHIYLTQHFSILFDVLNNIRLFRTKSIHQHRNLQYNEIQSLIAVHNTVANNNIYLMIIDMYKDLFHAFVKNFYARTLFEISFPILPYGPRRKKKQFSTLQSVTFS